MSTPNENLILYGTAVWIGLLHTLLGPDHYLPFVAMSRVGGWTRRKTLAITVLCGVGHVMGSILIGAAGIVIGIAVFKLETLEGLRADATGWFFLAIGALYFTWGIRHAIRNKSHSHVHVHEDGTVHSHRHTHQKGHLHVHDASASDEKTVATMTPWILFTLFIFGPCEALIPMLMYPAAKGQWWDIVGVTALFGVTTVATMSTMVMVCLLATDRIRVPRLERYSHMAAGFVLLACGALMKAGL